MTLFDAAILVAVALVGVLGYRDGLVRALWALVGVLLGTAIGLVVVPLAFQGVGLSWWLGLISVCVVVGCAAVGRYLVLRLEQRVRTRSSWRPVPWLDRTAGAVFGVLTGLGFSWLVGVALAGSVLPHLSAAANGSSVLRQLDGRMPLSHLIAGRFEELGDRTDFPRYVDVLTAEEILDVPAPPADVVDEVGVERASKSVWRILTHDAGMFGSEGTGFLVAPERLMTAAHVVARADGIEVDAKGGRLPATVVFCDPTHDVAVLAVPGLSGVDLAFASADGGDPAAVIGFPENGPLKLTPARVREQLDWQSADIYGDGRYDHSAYAVRTKVRPGNSGGPMVAPDGRVLGVVVAFSRENPDTAYVLTADQVASALDAGRKAADDAKATCD
ncbi:MULTISPECIES: MarP family serine protease [unclassified Nocardioides]|uniref:MarP family serine protease n=1 Tax=unclassified Nocardioides TaxID=2615069 RepID=UPI003606ED85